MLTFLPLLIFSSASSCKDREWQSETEDASFTGDGARDPWWAATMGPVEGKKRACAPCTYSWTHLKHVLLLLLVSHNGGRGCCILPCPSLCIWVKAFKRDDEWFLILEEHLMREFVGAAGALVRSGEEGVKGWCLGEIRNWRWVKRPEEKSKTRCNKNCVFGVFNVHFSHDWGHMKRNVSLKLHSWILIYKKCWESGVDKVGTTMSRPRLPALLHSDHPPADK